MADSKMLQGQSIEIFNEGLGFILSRWSPLRTAVERQWGGRNSHLKAQQLAADVLSWFTQSKDQLYIDDLEDLLDEGMLSFNLEIQDGSVEEVADELMVMHEECLDGNFSHVEYLREASRNPAAYPRVEKIVNGGEDDDESADSDESIIEDGNSANMDEDDSKSESNRSYVNRSVNGPQPKVASEADDGCTMVSNLKYKGKKN